MLSSAKTVEQKVVLVYLGEVVRNEPNVGLGAEIVSVLQPAVCGKAVNGKGFIKKYGEELLQLFVRKLNLEGMVYSLGLGCLNKNSKIAEISGKKLHEILQRGPILVTQQAVMNFSKDLFLSLFRSVIQSLQSKRFQVVKSCEDILFLLLSVLGQEKFVYIIELMIHEQNLSPQIKNLVSNAIEAARKRGEKKASKQLQQSQQMGKFGKNRSMTPTRADSHITNRNSVMSNMSRASLYSNQMDKMRLSNFQRIQESPLINGNAQGVIVGGRKRHNSLVSGGMVMSRDSSGQSLRSDGGKKKKKKTKRSSGLSEFIKNQRNKMKQNMMMQQNGCQF